MTITKYAHACFVLEKDGSSLVIDPGVWTDDFVDPDNVSGILVTHEHPDHCDSGKISRLLEQNPTALVYGTAQIIVQLGNPNSHVATPGEVLRIGPFSVKFTGGEHAVIDPRMAPTENLGILVDEHVFYPGDSLVPPPIGHLEHVLLPVSAPWCKVAEVFQFIRQLKPDNAYPTHDAILSDTGKELVDKMCTAVCDESQTSYRRLPTGKSIELA